MIKIKLDVSKIDKSRLYKGAKGTYLDLVVYENESPNTYGNDYSVKQDCTKEDRDNGVKMPYIGNGKRIGQKAPPPQQARNIPRAQPAAQDVEDDSEIPF